MEVKVFYQYLNKSFEKAAITAEQFRACCILEFRSGWSRARDSQTKLKQRCFNT